MVSKTIPVNLDTLHPMFMRVGLGNLVASAAAFIISVRVASIFVAVSVLIGTAIGIINLSVMAKTVKSGFVLKSDKAQRFVMKRYYLKVIATILVIGILLSKGFADPIGLIIGFSIIIITTMATAIYFAKKELV